MKKIIVLVTILFNINCFAQSRKVEASHYIFPEFMNGEVFMHIGSVNKAVLNYNALTEEMIFENHGKKLALDRLTDIDSVVINHRVFVPYGQKFAELVYKKNIEFYVIHRSELIDPGKPAAYGGTSQTSSTTILSSMAVDGRYYEIALPDGLKTRPVVEYLIKNGDKYTPILTIRNLSKLYPDQSDKVKEYVKSNKVEFEEPQKMIGLVRFLENDK